MDIALLEKAPKIAVYSPDSKQPWDDAVTLVLTYAEIPYDLVYDKEVLDVYIIGGMSVYKFFYEHTDTLYITFIEDSYKDTDTFFPIDLDQIKADFKLEFQNKMNDVLSFSKWSRK